MISIKHKMTKTVVVTSLVLIGLTECVMIGNVENAMADPYTNPQTLSIDPHFGIVDVMMSEKNFERIEATILEDVNPWLDPEESSKRISDSELISILREAGFSGSGLKMAWAIVQAESTSRVYAHNRNRKTGDNSYGLFQINMIDGLGTARLEKYGLERNEDLFNPLTNASIAFKISDGGSSWGAWTTYKKAQSMVSQFPG